MIKRTAFTLAATAALALGTVTASPAAADVAGFYKGRVVTVMVPSGLGASLGLYARLFSEHFGKHIPGNPTVILTSRPGGGGTKGATYAYNAAPRDGTFVAEILAPSVLAPALRNTKFNALKLQWLGSMSDRPSTVSVWHTAPATTIAEARKKVVIMGSTGLGSETYLVPKFMNHYLGTKFKIVKGYKGGASVNKAMEQGEVQGRMNYYSGWTTVKAHWLREKKIIHLAQYGPAIAGLDSVPKLRDLVTDPEGKKILQFIEVSEALGMGFWVHPDVPKDRLAALRKAFMDTMKDQSFLADAKKRKTPISPISGEKLMKIVAAGLDVSPALVTKMKSVFGFKK
mgnify:CR=1 FL=1